MVLGAMGIVFGVRNKKQTGADSTSFGCRTKKEG
jgi:hypothetical protein